ncbi:hypothetical protein [Moorena producens]|uniref:hypothetical protein n=1 Tax=Moorena producens TaxID=1155739 RepID=UPI003C753858
MLALFKATRYCRLIPEIARKIVFYIWPIAFVIDLGLLAFWPRYANGHATRMVTRGAFPWCSSSKVWQ